MHLFHCLFSFRLLSFSTRRHHLRVKIEECVKQTYDANGGQCAKNFIRKGRFIHTQINDGGRAAKIFETDLHRLAPARFYVAQNHSSPRLTLHAQSTWKQIKKCSRLTWSVVRDATSTSASSSSFSPIASFKLCEMDRRSWMQLIKKVFSAASSTKKEANLR